MKGSSLTLSLLENCNVLSMLMWKALHESIHVESVIHASFLVATGRDKLSCKYRINWRSILQMQREFDQHGRLHRILGRPERHSGCGRSSCTTNIYTSPHRLARRKWHRSSSRRMAGSGTSGLQSSKCLQRIAHRLNGSLRDNCGGGNGGLGVHRGGVSGSRTMVRVQSRD